MIEYIELLFAGIAVISLLVSFWAAWTAHRQVYGRLFHLRPPYLWPWTPWCEYIRQTRETAGREGPLFRLWIWSSLVAFASLGVLHLLGVIRRR